MEISCGKGHAISGLSTMASHNFVMDGIKCASIESFIQCLKFEKASLAASIASDKAKSAKERGKKHITWSRGDQAFWKGVPHARDSKEHQDLLDTAVAEAARQCPEFEKALMETGDVDLVCNGKTREYESPMTEREYLLSLNRLRNRIRNGKA